MVESRKPHNWRWDSIAKEWRLIGGGKGDPLFSIPASGGFRIAGQSNVVRIQKTTGTVTGLTAVGTANVGVASITGMGSANIDTGDLLFYNIKGVRDGRTQIANLQIPTINRVYAQVVNPDIASAGSYGAIGIDIINVRTG